MAALEKRLEAHQQAYTLWIELRYADKESKEIDTAIMKCQTWREENCLYLTPEARSAFRKAYHSALDHAQFLKIHADLHLLQAAAQDVDAAGPIIVQGVALPSISNEGKRIEL